MTREYRFVQVDVFTERVSKQGTRMGRQSFIRIRIGMTGGRIGEILVGGSVVPVIEGRLRVP